MPLESRNRSRSASPVRSGPTRSTRSYNTHNTSSVDVAAGPCFSSPVINPMSRGRSS